ncbi:carboxymuconolactone decarboxylase family protein [Geobacillus sp. BMUD]|uniref:carboxymuconolactone decarboxylase family protein n=1 Tax=Geobacillus TaxID=129337 RepID=UPI0004DF1651|nr:MULTISPECIES: carboxymuconolactone decarboxylase family protein [Geobacillus]NNU85440.1 carboxymuconolactone decarboxylase family protein [Geobacillus sp. BMUD]
MARIHASTFGNTLFQKRLGHNKEVMEGVGTFRRSMRKRRAAISRMKRTLAQGNGCEYCKAKGKPEPHSFNEKIAVAVGFVEVFLKQKGDIPDSAFDILRESFSEGEISELCAFITFTTAQQYFGAIMKLEAPKTGS